MNTGLRRGELLGRRWADASFRLALLSIHAASAKTGQTRHLPLNPEALAALKRWRDQCGGARQTTLRYVHLGPDERGVRDSRSMDLGATEALRNSLPASITFS